MVYKITSYFGAKESFRSAGHKGIDFYMENGTPLRAITNGKLRVADYQNLNAGKTVFIDTEDGRTFIYGHLSKFAQIQNGQQVNAGDLIGYSGNSGHVVGANGGYHLHFGLKKGGEFIDPSQYIESIQHMNDSNFIAQSASHMKMNFFEYMQQHMDLIGGFISTVKLNMIHFITSTDYSPVIQLFKHIVQFIFLNT